MSNRIKSLLLSVFTFLLITGCQQQASLNEGNSLANDNLKGKVKRIRETTYIAVSQDGTWKKGEKSQVYKVKTYTENGFLISERNYYTDSDQSAGGLDNIYDPEYNLLRVEALDPNGGIAAISEVAKKTGKVNVLEYDEYYGEGANAVLTSKTAMIWQGAQLIEAKRYNAQEELISTSGYDYDEEGNLSTYSINMIRPQERFVKMLCSYEKFDSNGNWTLMFKAFESLPMKEFVERQIEYYD